MGINTTQKIKFSLKDFLAYVSKPQKTTDLFTFTKETLNEELYFLFNINNIASEY